MLLTLKEDEVKKSVWKQVWWDVWEQVWWKCHREINNEVWLQIRRGIYDKVNSPPKKTLVKEQLENRVYVINNQRFD